MLLLSKLCCLLLVEYVDSFVGETLEMRVSAVFQDCFNLTHYGLGKALRAPHEGGKVVKLYTLAGLICIRGNSAAESIKSMKIPMNPIGNRTCNLPSCTIVPQLQLCHRVGRLF